MLYDKYNRLPHHILLLGNIFLLKRSSDLLIRVMSRAEFPKKKKGFCKPYLVHGITQLIKEKTWAGKGKKTVGFKR